MPNRLAQETSPYLRQHKDNPVDWYPWGEEAFRLARETDRPVFLSIGYSSCHWCHVMEHGSFENEATAKVLNDSFVSVKVDREERPDIDEAYMTFVQLLTGHGGWPTSVFLTPDKKPIYGGTYWPDQDFRSICLRLAQLWKESRDELLDAAEYYSGALTEALTQSIPAEESAKDLVEELARTFDSRNGGFGGAPKFPPHTAIEYLLTQKSEKGREMAFSTLEKMALGGIRDHVGGGFHRYSTDGLWLLPHWEKMLYDNALMLANYSLAARVAPEGLRERFASVSEEIIAWLLREMRSPEGLFYSALDADSGGEEGTFYVWDYEELVSLADEEFARAYQSKPSGNFADESTGRASGKNILHLREPACDRYRKQLDRLLTARTTRVRPGLDDKAIVGWNGLAIYALVFAGALGEAEAAARAILDAEEQIGKLPHQITSGKPQGEAFIEDYAYLAYGLLHLPGFRPEAERLGKEMVERFYDQESGGFLSTGGSHEQLFGRTKPVLDQPLPSANAIAIRVLIALGEIDLAKAAISSLSGWLNRVPHGTEALATTALQLGDRELDQNRVRVSLHAVLQQSSGLRAVIRISVPEGWHIQSHDCTGGLIPTRVDYLRGSGSVTYPESENHIYEGDVLLHVASPTTGSVALAVHYQACSASECLLPETVNILI